jgi:hypothetical protein
LEVLWWLVHHGFLLGHFFRAVEIAEGRTTSAVFFGLSSSLKGNYSNARKKKQWRRRRSNELVNSTSKKLLLK